MTIHNFNVEAAEKYDMPAAVILTNLSYWIEKNKANGKHFHDGYYWTYNSKKAFTELFPYMTQRRVEIALKKLVDDGAIITGNYNNSAYDRTTWYAITEKGYSIMRKREMEVAKTQNGFCENVEPIPDNKPDTKPNIKHNNKHKYGEYENVLLSDDDMEKLKTEFPSDWEKRIENLSSYMASTGKSYKNHLATIRNWSRRDKGGKTNGRNENHSGENEPKMGVFL